MFTLPKLSLIKDSSFSDEKELKNNNNNNNNNNHKLTWSPIACLTSLYDVVLGDIR